jgi:hypothetical protein
MQRRSALGYLAAAVAGLSLGELPDFQPEPVHGSGRFVSGEEDQPQSGELLSCPGCGELGDSLELTLAGVCLRCADRNPALRVRPRSDPFWTLSPRETRRAEAELHRLSAELTRMNRRFSELRERQLAEGSDVYDRAMEAGRADWLGLQREVHLLGLLRAASGQIHGV